MTAPELLHRIAEQAHRLLWRFDRSGWGKFDKLLGDVQTNKNLVSALSAPLSETALSILTREVENIRTGMVTLLGTEWPVDMMGSLNPILWLHDPISGRPWPGEDTFCFDVNYRQPSGYGDVKFVWELNRLQLLHPVAVLTRATKSSGDIHWMMNLISSWMQANPPFRGVNWSSGIELGLRLVSITVVVACIGEHLTEDDKRRIRKFVAAHGYWLERNPSLYSSSNNHRVAEGLGLLLASQLVPDLQNRLDTIGIVS